MVEPQPRAVEGVDYSKHYYDPTQQTRKNVNRNSHLSQDFFTDGTGRFVSDNGTANAQLYYGNTRPYGARLRSFKCSETATPGYLFGTY